MIERLLTGRELHQKLLNDGYDITELAKAVNLTKSGLMHSLKMERTPRLKLLEKLTSAIQKDMSYCYGTEGESYSRFVNGKELQEKLKKNNINIARLAKQMGTKPQNLYSIFKGNKIQEKIIKQIGEALGVPISWFYVFQPQMSEAASEAIIEAQKTTIEQLNKYITLLERLLAERSNLMNERLK